MFLHIIIYLQYNIKNIFIFVNNWSSIKKCPRNYSFINLIIKFKFVFSLLFISLYIFCFLTEFYGFSNMIIYRLCKLKFFCTLRLKFLTTFSIFLLYSLSFDRSLGVFTHKYLSIAYNI